MGTRSSRGRRRKFPSETTLGDKADPEPRDEVPRARAARPNQVPTRRWKGNRSLFCSDFDSNHPYLRPTCPSVGSARSKACSLRPNCRRLTGSASERSNRDWFEAADLRVDSNSPRVEGVSLEKPSAPAIAGSSSPRFDSLSTSRLLAGATSLGSRSATCLESFATAEEPAEAGVFGRAAWPTSGRSASGISESGKGAGAFVARSERIAGILRGLGSRFDERRRSTGIETTWDDPNRQGVSCRRSTRPPSNRRGR